MTMEIKIVQVYVRQAYSLRSGTDHYACMVCNMYFLKENKFSCTEEALVLLNFGDCEENLR